MIMTIIEAQKYVKQLNEKLDAAVLKERKTAIYHCSAGEDPEKVKPRYEFRDTQNEIENIEAQIRNAKHAINIFNTTTCLDEFEDLTIDQALVLLPQLKKRKEWLQVLASRLPIERDNASRYGSTIIDYTFTNYEIPEAEAEYRRTSDLLTRIQLVLDRTNNENTIQIPLPGEISHQQKPTRKRAGRPKKKPE